MCKIIKATEMKCLKTTVKIKTDAEIVEHRVCNNLKMGINTLSFYFTGWEKLFIQVVSVTLTDAILEPALAAIWWRKN